MMTYVKTKTPMYTLGEEISNAITHGLGAAAAIVGSVFLILKAGAGAARLIPSAAYAVSMVLLFGMSSVYHSISNVRAKSILRICDHSSVFLLIAGTYSPYTMIALRGIAGVILFSAVWITAVVGTTLNIFGLERFKKITMVCYILSGWSVIFAIVPLVRSLPLPGCILLFAGGIFYTVGLIFYRMKHVRFMHTIWHVLVLGGAVCHYFSILLYVL